MQQTDNFKTIDYPSAKPQSGSPNDQTSNSRPGHHWCLQQARLIASCYRRDEAHDPETFAAALAIVLSDYAVQIVKYAADPRTGIASAFPRGLPNVGQIKEFCDGVQSRQARIERYATLPRSPAAPLASPQRKLGQYSYGEFLEWATDNGTLPRPIGRFEQ